MEAALAAHLSPEVAAFVGQIFSLHEPREIEELLSSAGLHDVELRSSIQRLPLAIHDTAASRSATAARASARISSSVRS